MKKLSLFGFCLIFIVPLYITAQVTAYPPVPVAEKEIREGSIKMRSVQLERMKRNANRTNPGESEKSQKKRFDQIKRDFEKIQKLQNSIVKAYTTGKQINYSKIYKNSKNLGLVGLRLDMNLFGASSGKTFVIKSDGLVGKESVRNFIILLDKAIGRFVMSPIFKDLKTVDSKESQKTQIELRKVIYFSTRLSHLAKRKK